MSISATSLDSITDNEIRVDVLIIGTEAAGAKAAIEARLQGAKVLAVSKGVMGRSGATVMAGAGVQAPIAQANPLDSPEAFFSDVIKGGAYLNNQKLVERLVNMANSEVLKMEEWGARFIKTKDGKFVQGQAPGSSFPRTLWTIGQYGGRQWRKALKSEFKRQEIVPLEDFFVTSLLMTDGQVAGATGVSLTNGRFCVLRSKITIVATGGADQIYLHTDTPYGATGDGIVLAYNAGAELQDMEFHQFFPYHCYGPPGREHFVVPGLRYGLRGKLYNSQGEEFLNNYAPMSKGWALRDPTSRAIYLENKAGRGSPSGGAYLSVSHLPLNLVETTLASLAPRLAAKVKKAGIDLSKEAFEIGPASHYTIGGIRVNEDCDTNIPRLMAIGENAAGMDGAERIDAGPAITWCLTMGRIAGLKAAAMSKELAWLPVDMEQVASAWRKVEALYSRGKGVRGWEVKKKIKNLMWEECGLVRHQAGMEEALKTVREMKEKWVPELYVPGQSRCFNVGLIDALEAENMLLVSELTILSALMRRETRRSHYRTDYPSANDREWLKNIIVRKSGQENVFSTEAPIMHKMPPPADEYAEESHGPRR